MRSILIFFLSVFSISCFENFRGPKNCMYNFTHETSSIADSYSPPRTSLTLNQERFHSCQDYEKYIKEQEAAHAHYYGNDALNIGSNCSVAIAESNWAYANENQSQTFAGLNFDQQELGSAEPDMTATDGKYLYIGRNNSIEKVFIKNSKRPLVVAERSRDTRIKNTKLTLVGDHLIAYGTEIGSFNKFVVMIFNLRSNESISVPHKTIYMSGQILGARLIGNKFYLVSQNNIRDQANLNSLSCDNIYKPSVNSYFSTLTNVMQIDFTNLAIQEKQIGYLGKIDNIYVTAKNLYFLSQVYGPIDFNDSPPQPVDASGTLPVIAPDENSFYTEHVIIQKIALTNAELLPTSLGALPGHYRNEWAFKELDDQHLALALTQSFISSAASSTSSSSVGGIPKENNTFTILSTANKKMKITGQINNIAPTENIRAVRYRDNFAYVVTFKKTDPLYIIDTSVRDEPKIVSELKAPGFSTHLLPLDRDTLLGIGFGALDMGSYALFQGIQVSIIDVKSPLRPNLFDQIEFGSRGSFSDATHDHHSIYFDSDSKIIGLPIVEKEDFDDPYNRSTIKRSGFVMLNYNQHIEEFTFFTHRDWISNDCLSHMEQFNWWDQKVTSADVQRVLKVDANFLSVSKFGLKMHDPINGRNVLDEVKFAEAEVQCSTHSPTLSD